MNRLAAIALVVTACGPGAPVAPTDSQGGPSTTTGAPVGVPAGTVTGPTGGPGLSGVLVGPDGALGDRDLLFCNLSGCTIKESEPDGSFFVALEPGWTGAFKTHGETEGQPRVAAVIIPLVVPGEELALGTVYAPGLPPGIPFQSPSEDPQVIDGGDGLTLTLNRGDLSPPLGTWLYDLAAARVPDEYLRAYPELGDETVVAAFAIHPFGATSTSPIAVRAPVDLPAGTAVRFRSISHVDGTFSDPVDGTCDGSVAVTAPGEGLSELTWVVVSTP